MYTPEHFAETHPDALFAILREFPLASIVTTDADGSLSAEHIPLLLFPEIGPLGTLRGHVAKKNPLASVAPRTTALAIFTGPQAYVSPNWYPTKAETGKVVPTWNYVAVHVRATIATHAEPEWLLSLLHSLTNEHERALSAETGDAAWSVGDAPGEFTDAMLRAIVGIELRIDSIEGKVKASQNQPQANRDGVVSGLASRADRAEGDFRAMADVVRRGGRL